jgi:maltose-binding protein MalE
MMPSENFANWHNIYALIYVALFKDNPLLRQLNAAVEYGQVMPNIPKMGRFFSSVSGALQIATQGRASAQAALQEAEANIKYPILPSKIWARS